MSSFRARLLLGVIVPVIVIQTIGTGLELYEMRGHKVEQAHTEGHMTADITSVGLRSSFLEGDLGAVRSRVEAMVHYGVATHAWLERPDGSIFHEAAIPGAEKTGELVSQVVPGVTGDPADRLGTFYMVLNMERVAEEIRSEILHHIVFAGIILALISLSVLLILSRIARPVQALTEQINAFHKGDLDRDIPEVRRSDEIGALAVGLDNFRNNLREMAVLRAQNDEAKRRERKRIRRALETARDAIIITDENRRVAFCNAAARSLLGPVELGEKLDASLWLKEGETRRAVMDFQDEGGFSTETILPHPETGEDLRLRIWVGQIRDEDGGFLGILLNASDHTELVREATRAQYLAEHDSLTGLPNRRLLEDTLAHWVHEEKEKVWVLLADLDHFKLINDTLGHPVGDALLQDVAKRFERCAGPNKLAARLGGDEFAVVAKGPTAGEVLRYGAEGLVEDLSKPLSVEGRILHTGISIGIGAVEPGDHSSSEAVRRADLALYEAKKNGRGRIEVFHDNLEAVIKRKSMLDRELRKAIKAGDLFPVYQLQTNLRTGEICGFEALARWRHPKMGFVSPAEFIPVAEEMGLIGDVTHSILTHACQTAVDWREMGFDGRIAVNLSPRLFGGQVQEFVADVLFAQNCPASAIEIEITETVVLASGDAAMREIEALQALGLTIALDDFGMGYSSLSYLQRFSVDKIKIDREFVSQLPHSPETRAIVIAITELGHALGMKVTGEGAETDVQRQILRDCNVDSLQGYVDGRPMDAGEATAMLRSALKRTQPRRA